MDKERGIVKFFRPINSPEEWKQLLADPASNGRRATLLRHSPTDGRKLETSRMMLDEYFAAQEWTYSKALKYWRLSPNTRCHF